MTTPYTAAGPGDLHGAGSGKTDFTSSGCVPAGAGTPSWLADSAPPSWLDEDPYMLPPDPEDPECGAGAWPAGGLAGGFAQGGPLDGAAPELSLDVTAALASGAVRDQDRGPGHAPGPGGPGADSAAPEDGTTVHDGIPVFAAVPGCGPSRPFPVSDDELLGIAGARQRLQSRQAWELYAALAELIRRRPAAACQPAAPGQLPAVWEEGTAAEAALQLAVTVSHAHQLLALAWDLHVKLPATSRRLRDGLVDDHKARIISGACANLTPAEAMAAEDILYGFPGTEHMTPWQIRDRIARAVLQVNPEAARRRREDAAKRDARVWAGMEDSGNMMIMGRELPPAAVLAMDQNLDVRARQLRTAGVTGSMRELRVLAFLERMGAADPLASRTTADGRNGKGDSDGSGPGSGPDGPGGMPGSGPDGPGGPGGPGSGSAPAGPGGVVVPVASVVHLTVPAATLTSGADRPGEMRGAGPVDPAACRDLAAAAAASCRTSWECTITDQDGRPVAHACGKPAPPDRKGPPGGNVPRGGESPGSRYGPAPPGTPAPSAPGPATRTGTGTGPPSLIRIADGPDPRYGTWLYTHGPTRVILAFEHLAGACDHRHQAAGHDPGKHLRHLTAILNQSCTSPVCTWTERACDYEHSHPYEQGGRTCLCEAGPVCRHDHRIKQGPGWKLRDTGTRGWFRWTTPSGRTYLNGPTSYPT